MRSLARDFRYALRQLRKNSGFTAVAVIALALGVGLSTTIFSVFYNGVLHPFPYRDASRLTVISVADLSRGAGEFRSVFHLDEIAAFRRANHAFEDIVAYGGWDVPFTHQGASEQIHGCAVTPNMMDFWGVPPLLGRGLTEQDAQPNASPVVLLSYAFWKSRFNGDKSVLGTQIMVNGEGRTIVGIMPKRFGLFGADLYITLPWNRPEPTFAQMMEKNQPMYFFATALIKPNVSLKAAGADLQPIAQENFATHRQDYPDYYQMTAMPMNDVIVSDFKQTMLLLIAAVLLLLFISSSNVASLQLTHHTSRAREIALRSALGASRGRLVRQLFVESLVLGFGGCVFGCLLALIGLRLILFAPGLQIPGEAELSLNLPVLLFTVATSMLTTLFFGLSPALLAVKRDLWSNLQTSGVNQGAARGGVRLRAGLVVGQVALSMLLLVFAGLMMRSFFAMLNFDTGIRTHGLLSAFLHVPGHSFDSPEGKRVFFEGALPRIAQIPGVTHVAVTIGQPMRGSPGSRDVTIPGKPHEKSWTTAFEGVSEDYFTTLGLQLLHGRLLSAADVASAHRVAVVNRALVKAYFGAEDPIGHQIKFNELDDFPPGPHNAYFEIIGVVSDFKNFGFDRPVMPQAYLPYNFTGFGSRSLLIRTSVDPATIVNDVRKAVAEIDPNALLVHPETLDSILEQFTYMKPKFRVISFGTCAGIGLALAMIGLFGVIAYSVTLQMHDFGVRIALGAQSGNILSLVLRKGLWLVGTGIVVGLMAALLSVRVVRSELWGVSMFDLRTLVIAPLALLATGLLACYIPARRAIKVDPMVALRHD